LNNLRAVEQRRPANAIKKTREPQCGSGNTLRKEPKDKKGRAAVRERQGLRAPNRGDQPLWIPAQRQPRDDTQRGNQNRYVLSGSVRVSRLVQLRSASPLRGRLGTAWCMRIRSWCASTSLPGSAPRRIAIRFRPASDSTTAHGAMVANRERRRSSPAIPGGRGRIQQVPISRAYLFFEPCRPSERGRAGPKVSFDRATRPASRNPVPGRRRAVLGLAASGIPTCPACQKSAAAGASRIANTI
jgi:hypothetical protein